MHLAYIKAVLLLELILQPQKSLIVPRSFGQAVMTLILYQPGDAFKKAGVLMLNLSLANQVQTNLFDTCDRERVSQLINVIDGLNCRFGSGTIGFVATGLRQPWKLRQNRPSGRFTTCWNDILQIS